MSEKKTPLYDAHVACGGKIVPFAGYLLPVEYEATGLMKEHMAVRTACGMFDVSHMGEVTFDGPDALAVLNSMVTNDLTTMNDGRCRYSPMCYDDGGVVDDLLVYRKAADSYLVIVNAANRHKDVAWMQEHIPADADMKFEDISDSITQIAVQGPLAEQILAKIADETVFPTGNYTFIPSTQVAGIECIMSRTGYTGEDGFELYCSVADGVPLWNAILEAGKDDGLVPCGLGARDTLRLEAAMPLYGQEMDAEITPLETGLGIFVKLDKGDFIGREALASKPVERKRVGLEVTGRGIIREHEHVYVGDAEIGFTTSGTYMPFLKKACAMAIVAKDSVELGDEVEVDVRGRRVAAKVVELPFYKTKAVGKK